MATRVPQARPRPLRLSVIEHDVTDVSGGVWSPRPASKRRGSAPIPTVAQGGWSLGRAAPWGSRPWRGEGRATLCGDPQGGGGQALVAPLLPGEPPHEWPVDHPRSLQPLHLVLGEVALDGGRGRVASHREPPASAVQQGQAQGEPEVAGRSLAVPHPALVDEP